MAMDYTTLVSAETVQGSIKFWVNYSRIDADGILDEAEAWIYARLRVRQMVAADDVAISSAATTASFPSGYLDPIHLSIPGHIETIRLTDAERFRSLLGWDTDADLPEGPPTRWADIGDTIHFNHKADQAYTAKFVFFKKPDALSGSNETNFLTDRLPTLLRRVCTMFAAEARKDWDMRDRSEISAMEMIEQAKKESDLSLRGLESEFHWESNP